MGQVKESRKPGAVPHGRNKRLQFVRDQLSHVLYLARAQLLSDRSR